MEEAKNAGPYVPSEEALKKRKEREAWSQKNELHDVKEAKRERKRRKWEAERLGNMTEEERAKEMELQKLIEQVKKKNLEDEEEFKGFDD